MYNYILYCVWNRVARDCISVPVLSYPNNTFACIFFKQIDSAHERDARSSSEEVSPMFVFLRLNIRHTGLSDIIISTESHSTENALSHVIIFITYFLADYWDYHKLSCPGSSSSTESNTSAESNAPCSDSCRYTISCSFTNSYYCYKEWIENEPTMNKNPCWTASLFFTIYSHRLLKIST